MDQGREGGRQGGWIRFSGRLHLDPSKPWQTFVSVEQRPKEAGLPTSRAAHEADLTEHCPLHGCAYYRLSPPCDGQAPGGGSPSAPELEKGKTENFADALSSHTCRRLHLYTDTHTFLYIYTYTHTHTVKVVVVVVVVVSLSLQSTFILLPLEGGEFF